MNVLGKIKSKKNIVVNKGQQKLEIKESKNQIQQKDQLISDGEKKQLNQFSLDKRNDRRWENQKKPIFATKSSKTREEKQFITNNNIISKQKQRQSKSKEHLFTTATNSISSSLSYLNKKTKKPGVYFDDNPSLRQNSLFNNQNSKGRSTVNSIPSNQENQETDEQLSLDFDFLLTNRQKKQIKKSLHLSKGKMENIKSIQQELLQQNEQVLCFIVKKWYSYGDIYMFEGQLQSLKKRFILVDYGEKNVKIYDRIKIKISCTRNMLIGPQTIGRLYLSDIVFLSQNQAMINQSNLLKIIQKSLRIKKK